MSLITFKINFNMDALRANLEKEKQRIYNNTMNTLKSTADNWFTDSRLKIGDGIPYKDQLGDLLSSTGYIIMYNGEIIHERFEMVLDGHHGLSEGKAFAREIAEGYPMTGYVLICVAGMGYAGYLESKGYNVITGSSNEAKQELERLFKKKTRG